MPRAVQMSDPSYPFPSAHVQYIFLSLAGTLIGVFGSLLGSDLLTFQIPAALGGIGATMATFRLALYKKDIIGFSVTTSTFVFFQLYQLNPLNSDQLLGEVARFEPIEILIGNALSNMLAGGLLISANLWKVVFPGQRFMLRAGRPFSEFRHAGWVFFGFCLVFVAVAVPNLVWGGVVRDAINGVIYGYSSWEVTGTGPKLFEDISGTASSLANLRNLAPSLLVLSFLLFRSRFRVVIFATLPLSVIWSAGILVGGTRTYLLAFLMICLVILITDQRVKRRALAYVILGSLSFVVIARVLMMSRTEGLKNFALGQVSLSGIATFQGNEGLIYHMDAVAFSRSGFVSPWSTGSPVADFVVGLVYEPLDALLIWIPRSVMPWKPQDPTWIPYNVFTWNVQTARSDAVVYRTYSAGFAGRDLIRWGPMGVIIPLFWFGAFYHFAGLVLAAYPTRLTNRVSAGILVGIGLAMMRDINFMWTLPLLPALLTLIVAQRGSALPASADRRFR